MIEAECPNSIAATRVFAADVEQQQDTYELTEENVEKVCWPYMNRHGPNQSQDIIGLVQHECAAIIIDELLSQLLIPDQPCYHLGVG
jgi:hypothetical protein